jgi:hypothetical protein
MVEYHPPPSIYSTLQSAQWKQLVLFLIDPFLSTFRSRSLFTFSCECRTSLPTFKPYCSISAGTLKIECRTTFAPSSRAPSSTYPYSSLLSPLAASIQEIYFAELLAVLPHIVRRTLGHEDSTLFWVGIANNIRSVAFLTGRAIRLETMISVLLSR